MLTNIVQFSIQKGLFFFFLNPLTYQPHWFPHTPSCPLTRVTVRECLHVFRFCRDGRFCRCGHFSDVPVCRSSAASVQADSSARADSFYPAGYYSEPSDSDSDFCRSFSDSYRFSSDSDYSSADYCFEPFYSFRSFPLDIPFFVAFLVINMITLFIWMSLW